MLTVIAKREQHSEQHRHRERHERYVVERDGYDIAHQPVVGQPYLAKGVPPHVAATMAAISAAVHRLSLRLDLTPEPKRSGPFGVSIVFTLSGPFSCMNALPRRQSRYTQANSAANAATQ